MKSLNDLNRIEPELLQAIQEQVKATVSSGWFVLGENVSDFEQQFATHTGVSNCISVANGTDALEIALRCIGVGPTSRVGAVANAGFYSSTAIFSCGGQPLYVDVDTQTHTMSVEHLAETLHREILTAVIVTHLYGTLAKIEEIRMLCDKHRVPLIEDCAQAHGAMRSGKKAGSFGDLSCFSFYPTKNLGAMGDGGAICTNDTSLASRVRALRQYGWSQKYHVAKRGGRNSRLDEIQASILSLKLPYLDEWNAKRRRIAMRFNDEILNSRVLRKPQILGEDYVAHLYVLQVQDRQDLMRHLKEKGVPHDIHYPIPDYRQQAYVDQHGHLDSTYLRNTEELSQTIITLPSFPGMTEHEIDSVVEAMNAWGK